jgi:S1-C subfamily serine protease
MSPPSHASSLLQTLSNNLADAAAQVGPSIVAIATRQRLGASGIVWQPGTLVTVDRALQSGEEAIAIGPDGREVTATVAGRDASTDLAVLKVPATEVTVAPLGETANVRVGHIVLAVGRSRQGSLSASMGTVGTIGGAWRTWRGGQIDRLLRPDISLYQGLSGSALVDSGGMVLGLNTAGLSRSGSLTIPTETVNRIVAQLLATGRIPRGYLGVSMQPVRLPGAIAQRLHLTNQGGVMVVDVDPDGPADRGGLMLGDILVAIGEQSISDTDDVLAQLGGIALGNRCIYWRSEGARLRMRS